MRTSPLRGLPIICLLATGLAACSRGPAPEGQAPPGPTQGWQASAEGQAQSAPPGPDPYAPPPATAMAPTAMVAGSAPPPAPAAASDARFQRLPVVDPSGFEKPMPALWVEVPAGWQASGGVVWNAQAPCGASPSYQWHAQSPDGQRAIALLPAEAWTWDNLGMDLPGGRCPRWPITDVRAYLQSWVQRNRPGARLLDYRARNDLVVSPPPASDGQTRYWKEGGELLIAYAGPGGETREAVAAVVLFNETTMAGVMPGEVRRFLGGLAGSPVATRAPAGQLDLDLLTHFARSVQPDPQWQARMDRHNQQLAAQGLQGQRERGAIIADTQRTVADIQQAGWESRNDSSDAMHRRTIDGINNVDRYADPVTGNEVQLDNRYDHAWRTQDGTYLQSNDPNLNPSTDLGVDAEAMERIE